MTPIKNSLEVCFITLLSKKWLKIEVSLLNRTILCLFCITFIIAPTNTYSQTPKRSFTFITDQDYFYIDKKLNEDRNYTQGTSFTLSNTNFYSKWLFAPFRGINKLHNKIFKDAIIIPTASSVTLLGTAFTPIIIDSINPIIGDRPFAFLLALSTTQINEIGLEKNGISQFEAININYGLLGTNIGYEFQSFAHKHIVKGRPIDPKGWNHQISRGGKPTFLINYERILTFSTKNYKPNTSKLSADGFINLGGSVGYYERAYTSAYFRFGLIDHSKLPRWAFWGQSLASSNRDVGTNIDSLPKKRHFEVFLFNKGMFTYIHRNALLVGQRYVNNDIYTLNPAWTKRAVFDYTFGISCGFYWIKDISGDAENRFIRIIYNNTIRSPEFDSKLEKKRTHYFGSIGFEFSI